VSSTAISVMRRLQLINGPLLNARLADSDSRLIDMLRQGLGDEQIIERYYWLALSRPPNEVERSRWVDELQTATSTAERQTRLEDFVWSLLNCQEFVTNH
jgi:hypothetical protein